VTAHDLMINVVTLLAVVAVATTLSRWVGLGSVLAMLLAGIALGPFGFAIAPNVARVRGFSELGVVLLLFTIGLEMEPRRLWAMRRLVFGRGTLQVLVTGALVGAFMSFRGVEWRASVMGGLGFALSSTAIGMQFLEERQESHTPAGRATFAILLLQDLAIVPLLALVPLLAGVATDDGDGIGVRLLMVLAVLAGTIVVGRWVLPFVLRQIDDAYGFVAVVLLAILGVSLSAEAAGLSMALGAFVLGMALTGSPFERRIEAVVDPLKHALLALFFIAIGMSIDVGMLAERGGRMAVSVVCILALKMAALYVLARWFGQARHGALRIAAVLSQAGEFGFVLFGAMRVAGLIDDYQFNVALLGIGLSMAVTPLLVNGADRIADRIEARPA
jgi:glutathione-regulated potassium-efflux system ancillary protein KefC